MNATKIAELIAIATGLFIIYRLWTQRQAAAAGSTSMASATAGAKNITPAGTLPGQPGYAWQYFSDGTAIAPDGSYYLNGVKVWDPFMPTGGATVSA